MIKQARQFYRLHREWLGDGVQPVSQEVADRRAGVCLDGCPKHEQRPIYEHLAGVAADTARRIIAYKNHLKLQVAREEELHICGVCECILRSLVWTPIDVIVAGKGSGEIRKLPLKCWQRAEAGL